MSYYNNAVKNYSETHIAGLTICVDYDDFLRETLSENLHHFDEFLVVTSFEDTKTQNLCEEQGVTCVKTDVFSDGGGVFNKGLAVNLGLAHLSNKGWITHIDADIVLPDRFRTMLAKEQLDTRFIYGADRVLIRSFEEWQDHSSQYHRQYHHRYMVSPEDFPLGARIIHDEFGYCPIGYFQLWHASQRNKYPTAQTSAEHTDLLFSLQWKRSFRKLLPGVITYHLDSENSPMGVNWQGRKSKRFAAKT